MPEAYLRTAGVGLYLKYKKPDIATHSKLQYMFWRSLHLKLFLSDIWLFVLIERGAFINVNTTRAVWCGAQVYHFTEILPQGPNPMQLSSTDANGAIPMKVSLYLLSFFFWGGGVLFTLNQPCFALAAPWLIDQILPMVYTFHSNAILALWSYSSRTLSISC